MELSETALAHALRGTLVCAWLAPLLAWGWGLLPGNWRQRLQGPPPASVSTFCIAVSLLLSLTACTLWARLEHLHAVELAAHGGNLNVSLSNLAITAHAHGGQHAAPLVFSGQHYVLAKVASLELAVDYYIDGLTVLMFVLVSGIALAVHVYSLGYLAEEASDFVHDPEVLIQGKPLIRPGRQDVYFAYLSLFSFAMLGLVQSGSLFLTFVFWELVGASSYLLIGFYREREAACAAATKAFVMNRVGDAGFLIGMSILWTYGGTLAYVGDSPGANRPGLFDMVRGNDGQMRVDIDDHNERVVILTRGDERDWLDAREGGHRTVPYGLLVAAGLGIVAGCLGKSAQFPLQTWLPDAMAGPTPVSALVHSATMVAAGVYLVARVSPLLTPEVLLVVAYIGVITLLIGAMTAVAVNDIKRVLAYSTISQLGYMLLGLGVGGWSAGVFHLVTHACFKSLLFLAAGSVILQAHHVQDLSRLGGLWRRMPITAGCMLVGAIALAGLAVPFTEQVLGFAVAFSGYHSKDAILAAAMAYSRENPVHIFLLAIPVVGAGLTSYYIARLWCLAFWGAPRDGELAEHVSESPRLIWIPLVVLAVLAAIVGCGGEQGPLYQWIERSEPLSVIGNTVPNELSQLTLPDAAAREKFHAGAAVYGLIAALAGLGVAVAVHGQGEMPSEGLSADIGGVAQWLRSGWRFDEIYTVMIVQPLLRVGSACAVFDQQRVDAVVHGLTVLVVRLARVDRQFDERVVDGTVRWIAWATQATGQGLRLAQTGQLRQYITLLAAAVLCLCGWGIFLSSR